MFYTHAQVHGEWPGCTGTRMHRCMHTSRTLLWSANQSANMRPPPARLHFEPLHMARPFGRQGAGRLTPIAGVELDLSSCSRLPSLDRFPLKMHFRAKRLGPQNVPSTPTGTEAAAYAFAFRRLAEAGLAACALAGSCATGTAWVLVASCRSGWVGLLVAPRRIFCSVSQLDSGTWGHPR